MKKVLLIFLCALSLPGVASHIVGGEFQILHRGNYRYEINLIMYFDEVFGEPGNKTQDSTITATIYRFSDNAFMENVKLKRISESLVDYTQPACSIDEIKTSKQFYAAFKDLLPGIYNDPQGYYIVWERCCRNYSIINIFSDAPDIPNAIPAGQTFYLKFPPVIKNGVPFINSSVASFKPLSDYACPNKPYYADFSGVDADGDILVYSIVEPLSTHSAQPYPAILPAPYPKVTWVPPFSFSNVMGGKRDLKISSKGFLTVTPGNIIGLYVFAVKCEEFRSGEKIGESRRDFQLYVSANCPDDVPPQITGRKKGDVNFSTPDAPLNLTFSNTTSDDNRCIEVRVTDADAAKSNDNFEEKIKITVIPINFDADISEILPADTTATLTGAGSKADFKLCFDQCPPVNGPFKIGVLAFDDACALPLGDTLYVTVNIAIPELSKPPKFTKPENEQLITATLTEGETREWPIEAKDVDGGDVFNIRVETDGFNLDDFGMSIGLTQPVNGLYTDILKWNTECDAYDFSTRTIFKVWVILEYTDYCGFIQDDTITFDLTVKSQASKPIIYSSLDADKLKRTIEVERNIYDSLNFTVTGDQPETDYLRLNGKGKDFNIADYNISFPSKEGLSPVASKFKWKPDCNRIDLAVRDSFDLEFIVVDNTGICKIYQADTLDVIVKIYPPTNNKPTLSINSLDPTNPLVNNTLSIELGQQITLALAGKDNDVNPADSIEVKLIEAKGNVEPKGYDFKPAKGVSPVTASLFWFPDCSIFENNVFENNYTFSFSVTDNRCLNILADTVSVDIIIHDVESNAEKFLPTNFITPNNDGCNDYFALEGIEIENTKCPSVGGVNPDEIIALPKDNCVGHFVNIQIYDRWGKEVFTSTQRNFRWYANDIGVGIYFYYLNYSNKRYKGTVTVRL